jgi:hypothetical protein
VNRRCIANVAVGGPKRLARKSGTNRQISALTRKSGEHFANLGRQVLLARRIERSSGTVIFGALKVVIEEMHGSN